MYSVYLLSDLKTTGESGCNKGLYLYPLNYKRGRLILIGLTQLCAVVLTSRHYSSGLYESVNTLSALFKLIRTGAYLSNAQIC